MSRKWVFLLVSVLFVFGLLSYLADKKEKKMGRVEFLTEKGAVSVEVEVADSYLKRSAGLMNRTELAQGTGMLFVFGREKELSFWMKDTYIPLDIIFISKGLEVVDIKKEVEPCGGWCKTYSSEEPAKYAVEVNAGFCEKYGIEEGTEVRVIDAGEGNEAE